MKKNFTLSISAVLLGCPACRKTSPNTTSIVGTWVMTGLSGTVASYQDSVLAYSEFDSYNDSLRQFISAYSATQPYFDSLVCRFTAETWIFSPNHTFAISENYTKATGVTGSQNSVENSCSGSYSYVTDNNKVPHLTLVNNPSSFPASITKTNSYTVQSISTTTMILSYLYDSVYSGGYYNSSYTVVFSRQ